MRLSDIVENIEKILAYTEGIDLKRFLADQKTCDATERCMLRIAEAAVKLGSFAEDRIPGHDWQAIRGIGNILRHDYDRVSLPTIWGTIAFNLNPCWLTSQR